MRLIISILILGFSLQSFSQSSIPDPDINNVVKQLFDGMRQGDSTIIKDVFHAKAQMASAFDNEEGLPVVREGSVAQFIIRAGIPHESVWDERINGLTIRQEDNLATAWMQYAFYLGDQFSHCGVNVMNLVKTSEGWKIYYLIDTRKKDDCEGYGE